MSKQRQKGPYVISRPNGHGVQEYLYRDGQWMAHLGGESELVTYLTIKAARKAISDIADGKAANARIYTMSAALRHDLPSVIYIRGRSYTLDSLVNKEP